ncbi:MAG: hypothetical protein DMG42_07420 [Acidobacteria bacterium]|nr:MAG: hypothetical protein DMG42_07420 [Acidobacteriota bacterium]
MRKQLLKWMSLGSIALAVLLFAVERAAADDDDPPSRVARLAYTNGNISFNPAGTDDWVAAVVNRPMTTGDKLWSDDRSRAELHLDTAVIRLSDHTGFSFLNLSDEITQLRLTEGTLYIRVRRLGDDETFEVDTPNLAFSILRPGRYRINVNEAGDATIVAVRDGQGEVTSGGSAYAVHAREEGVFNGTDQLDADVERIRYDEDEFDQWCNERDPIVTAIGCGSRLGAGLGLTTNRGALLRSTMAVGWLSAACGAGCRALRDRRWLPLLMCARCMRLRSSRGSAAHIGESAWPLAVRQPQAWRGSPWDRATSIARRTA